MDNLTEAKRQIDALPKVLKEDFRILFKFNCEYKDAKTILFPKLINLIEEAYGLPESPPKVRILIFQHIVFACNLMISKTIHLITTEHNPTSFRLSLKSGLKGMVTIHINFTWDLQHLNQINTQMMIVTM